MKKKIDQGKLTLAQSVALTNEALQADALKRSWHVDAFGVSGASVRLGAFVRVDTAVDRVQLIARQTVAPVAALGIHALRVRAARILYLALVYIC